MPIYVYRCSHCGHTADVLQKMSDPKLVTCPACAQDTYEKQVTAASFRLKGTGWYETDFRGGGPNTASSDEADKSAPAADTGASEPSSGAVDAGKSPASTADSGTSGAAAAPTPA